MEKLIQIANEAAFGIDQHIQGIATKEDYSSIDKLKKYLEEGVKERDEHGYLYGDSIETFLISEVLGKNIKSPHEIAYQTNLLSKELQNIKSISIKELCELRELCVNLSEKAMAYEDN